MSRRWFTAAVIMAALGFVAIVARPEQSFVAKCSTGVGQCRYTYTNGGITTAILNAAIWFGIVYLLFLIVYVVRRVIKR